MNILLTADPELPVPPRMYGGIERIVDELVRGLRARGHQVALIAHPDSTTSPDRFYPWPGLASRGVADVLKNTRALRAAVAGFRPELIHSFSRLLYLFPFFFRPIPKVMSYQREPTTRTTAWASRLARALVFTGCSEHICRTGRRAGGVWVSIPNFVDLKRYTFREVVPANAPLVFLSRVEPIKGPHLAIEAARRCGRRLVIAGNHAEDGPNGRYWCEQIQPHLGRNGIEYVGPVDDRKKNDLLGGAAALIVPVQWEEPFGIVFVEALACGTPVISCPRGALPEIIRDGQEGFLCDGVSEMVEATHRLPQVHRFACRRRVEELFSSEVVVGAYEHLYFHLLRSRGAPV